MEDNKRELEAKVKDLQKQYAVLQSKQGIHINFLNPLKPNSYFNLYDYIGKGDDKPKENAEPETPKPKPAIPSQPRPHTATTATSTSSTTTSTTTSTKPHTALGGRTNSSNSLGSSIKPPSTTTTSTATTKPPIPSSGAVKPKPAAPKGTSSLLFIRNNCVLCGFYFGINILI